MKQQLIFLVGCARSGTTWLQLLLSQHPAIATLQESHLFPDFIGPGFQRWRSLSEEKSETGVASLMDRAQFIGLWRRFAEETLGVALVDKPNATFILEKTPNHVHHAQEILELFPDAYFVHLIRDPRAVVASLLDAGRSWARSWAPQSALPAAEMWRRAVLDGRQIHTLTSRYTEVGYETMLAAPEQELARVLGRLGLEADREFCRKAAEDCSAANIGRGAWKAWVPKTMNAVRGNTVRKGQAESWRSELTAFQISTVEFVTHDLLESLGYKPMTRPNGIAWARVKSTGALARFHHRVVRRLKGAWNGA